MWRVRDEVAFCVEHRAGEVEPLADVRAERRPPQHVAHLFGDRHVQVAHDLEQHRVDAVRPGERERLGRVELLRARLFDDEHAAGVVAELEAGLDHQRARGLEHEQGTAAPLPRCKRLAIDDRNVLQPAARVEQPRRTTRRGAGLRGGRRRLQVGWRSVSARFDARLHQLDRVSRPRVAEQLFVLGAKRAVQSGGPIGRERERGLGAGVAQVQAANAGDLPGSESLGGEHLVALFFQRLEHRFEPRELRVVESDPPCVRVAVPGHVRQPHAVGREHAGKRMQKDAADTQAAGNSAGVLPAGSAEDDQRVVAHVVAARYRDLADRLRHVVVGDVEETLGELLRSPLVAVRAELRRQRFECGPRSRRVDREREAVRRQPAERQIHVRERQLAGRGVAVAQRTGIGARTRRADAQGVAVVAAQRPAACGHRVYAHHWSPHADAGHLGLVHAIESAVVARHVGRGPAHVEGDSALDPGAARHPGGRHHAAGRP